MPKEFPQPAEHLLRLIAITLHLRNVKTGESPTPERRAEISARVHAANTKLGEFGYAYQEHELAARFRRDMVGAIEGAYINRKISVDSENEPLSAEAINGAKRAFIERSQEKVENVTAPGEKLDLYLPIHVGASFVERKEALLRGETPVELGSDEFQGVRKFVEERIDSEPGVKIDSNYTLVIIPRPPHEKKPEPTGDPIKDKILAAIKVMVQPCLLKDNDISHHEASAERKEAYFGGEIKFRDVSISPSGEIERETAPLDLERICDLSGHYRTPGRLDFALGVLKYGYGVRTENVTKEVATLDTRRPPYRTEANVTEE